MFSLSPFNASKFRSFHPALQTFFTDFLDTGNNEKSELALDVWEDEQGQIVVEASLPGFKKEDIDIEINKGVLSIKASRSEEEEKKKDKYFHRERRYTSFSRALTLPGPLQEDKVEAQLKDGVLTIRIPQEEEKKLKRITIS